jgi:hypothetical protein
MISVNSGAARQTVFGVYPADRELVPAGTYFIVSDRSGEKQTLGRLVVPSGDSGGSFAVPVFLPTGVYRLGAEALEEPSGAVAAGGRIIVLGSSYDADQGKESLGELNATLTKGIMAAAG